MATLDHGIQNGVNDITGFALCILIACFGPEFKCRSVFAPGRLIINRIEKQSFAPDGRSIPWKYAAAVSESHDLLFILSWLFKRRREGSERPPSWSFIENLLIFVQLALASLVVSQEYALHLFF